MRVKYVGDVVPHLKNQWVDIPDDLHLYQATSWIEVNLKEPEIDAYEPQGQELEAEVAERVEDVDELGEMREQLAALHDRLSEPDVSRAAEAISSTARAMQSSWNISQDLKKLEEQARSQTSHNQALQEQAQSFAKSAEKERKKTTDLIAANQKIVNNAFNSYSSEMKALRNKIAEADHEIRMLKQAASENSALLKKAGKIIKEWEARA
ncbi:hypothetical protein SynMEDNS5_01552 [Synechococcus sp. MEDNS5]|uniref:hypothetical protein n=1 Tax=Synechococcus sp. MEDNS5 TaxID=1442554 RepID=UPI00164830F3|nr:hypothetical protein [Synechococcus sp. MEDNS5]QNJ06271.1 hypothetical protein SynMEDNS5_01552 [Synechococcus sp. MEDNS5]